MKIKITENRLKELINSNIIKMLNEVSEYKPSPMEELEYECTNLIEYLNVYRELLNGIPHNTKNIISEISDKLNALCPSKLVSFNYDENNILTLMYTGNFASIENDPKYNYENELYEYINDYLGNYNYGGNGVFEAKIYSVSFEGGVRNTNFSNLIIEVSVSNYANPTYLRNLLRK